MKLEVLEEAARECGKLVLKMREKGVTATDKDEQRGAHFVTEADLASQELGMRLIREKFKNEVIVAEEEEWQGKIPQDCTVFDPVDGTTRFYNNGDDFGVTFCTLREGRPEMGVMYFPALDTMFTCERGQGVYLNGKKLESLAWNKPMDKTQLGVELGPWVMGEDAKGNGQALLRILGNLLSDGFTMRSTMVGINGALEVLLQQTGAYYNMGIAKIWDGAAGALMVEELGGVVCDPWGNPVKWDSIDLDWIIAANQELADAVVQHTKKWAGRG